MSLDPDALIDRRRLKRSRALWRGGAVLAALALLAVLFAPRDMEGFGAGSPVARLVVSGTITDDRDVVQAVDRAAERAGTRALLLSIDSPGGTVAGGEALYSALMRFRESGKPVVAVMGGTAASAAYMVAMPSERIFARDATLTGSIGVLLQSFNVNQLMDTLGVKAETLTSGPLKAQPSPFSPLTEQGREVLLGVVADIQSRFVEMVAKGRNLPEARVRELADGRIYTGRQALALGLVDAIGGEREARAWLKEKHGIPETPEARDLDTTGRRGLSRYVTSFAKSLVSEGLASIGIVDGALSLWQPAAR